MAKHLIAGTLVLIGLSLLTAACGPNATSQLAPTRQRTPTRPVAATQSTPAPPAVPVVTIPSATVGVPTATFEVETSTSTAVPETPLPTSTPALPTPVIPAGLYVTYLYTIPDPPVRGSEVKFHVGIANNTNTIQTLRWVVYIYRPEDMTHSFGQTSITSTSGPTGANEFAALGYWKLSLGGPCEDFIARVAWLDQDNRAAQFKEPNGTPFEKAFTVCPP